MAHSSARRARQSSHLLEETGQKIWFERKQPEKRAVRTSVVSDDFMFLMRLLIDHADNDFTLQSGKNNKTVVIIVKVS